MPHLDFSRIFVYTVAQEYNMRCAKCSTMLIDPPKELPDGLPGIRYLQCRSCGHIKPVRGKIPRKVSLGRKKKAKKNETAT
jgi:DNA-directed RNA polymerase subunit M/transcription elongation factor TFIIS